MKTLKNLFGLVGIVAMLSCSRPSQPIPPYSAFANITAKNCGKVINVKYPGISGAVQVIETEKCSIPLQRITFVDKTCPSIHVFHISYRFQDNQTYSIECNYGEKR